MVAALVINYICMKTSMERLPSLPTSLCCQYIDFLFKNPIHLNRECKAEWHHNQFQIYRFYFKAKYCIGKVDKFVTSLPVLYFWGYLSSCIIKRRSESTKLQRSTILID